MANCKKNRATPHPPWITKTESGIETGYQKITRSLQYSDAVRGLSNLTYRVYIDMLISSRGLREVEYPQSEAMRHMKISKGGYTDAINKLIEVGLINRKP